MLSDTTFDKLDQLPALSPATAKLIELANDSRSTAKDLMNIIKTDPVLTGKILALINSSFFSLNDRIFSLNRAIILLGFNTIKHIALSTSLFSSIASGSNSFKLAEVWKHMVAVAIAAKIIAKNNEEIAKEAENYFTAGLLHDIGDILLLRHYPKEYQELCVIAKRDNLTISKVCQENFDITPSEIGAKATKNWKFPEKFIEVIEFSRNPKEDCSDMTKAIHIIDKICRTNNFGFCCDRADIEYTQADLDFLKIENQDQLDTICAKIEVELEKASAFIE
jgi:HD-like signal output (HDOD) protein